MNDDRDKATAAAKKAGKADRTICQTPEARAALERQVFEAVRDVLYFEGKSERDRDPRYMGMIEANVRAAFNRHLERDWPAVQADMAELSDARLQDYLMDAVDRLDVLGARAWLAEREAAAGDGKENRRGFERER